MSLMHRQTHAARRRPFGALETNRTSDENVAVGNVTGRGSRHVRRSELETGTSEGNVLCSTAAAT